jgi:hypothetical protein
MASSTGRLRRAGLAAGVLAGAGSVSAGFAQSLGDATLTATISQRFEANSNYQLEPNPPGTSYFTDTRLAMGLLSETQTQTFSLGFDTGIRALWEAGEDFEFTFASPSTANVAYAQEWADAAFDTYFRYRQSDVDFDRLEIEFDEDTGLPDNLNQITGNNTERRYDAGVSLALATDSRSSYAFSAYATHFDYSEEDGGQDARTSATGEVSWSLQLTPTLQSQLVGSYYYYTADDEQDTELTVGEFDAWLNYEAAPNLTVGAALGYAHRQKDETQPDGTRERTENERGITARASINYFSDDFVLSGNARVTTAAPQTRLSGDLRADYPLPYGSVNARIYQRYTGGSSGNDEVRITGANVGFVRELTTLASLGLDFGAAYQETVDGGPADPDITRYDARVTFSYDLTEALSADVGYRFRYRDEGSEDADSHSVFFVIGRSFATRP